MFFLLNAKVKDLSNRTQCFIVGGGKRAGLLSVLMSVAYFRFNMFLVCFNKFKKNLKQVKLLPSLQILQHINSADTKH